MRTGALNMKQNDEYYTPSWFVKQIIGGELDYDPATVAEKAAELGVSDFDTKETDGLKRDWGKYKKVWINPPFSQKKAFLDKAVDSFLRYHNEIYFLCPIYYLTTLSFHQSIKRVGGFTLYLPEGRLAFENNEGKHTPAFGSVVIKIGGENKIIRVLSKDKE